MAAEVLKQQYDLLKESRKRLFDYCDTIAPIHFVQEMQGFGHGSMRNLLTHVANCYVHWLQNFAQSRLTLDSQQSDINSMADVRRIFAQVDVAVEGFLQHFEDRLETGITAKRRDGTMLTKTPLALFTHVFTHEFHHKGQIVSIGRQLGYFPVDTDVIE